MHDFNKLKCFVLIIGNARTGSTMLGSILDVHPNSIVANETSASSLFWRNLDRQSILNDIFVSSENNRKMEEY